MENWVGIIKSGMYGTETIICGRRKAEEDNETLCVERDIYRTRSGDSLARQKETKCYKERCGCENRNSSELTLREDQHWHESYRWFSSKIEWSQTLGHWGQIHVHLSPGWSETWSQGHTEFLSTSAIHKEHA